MHACIRENIYKESGSYLRTFISCVHDTQTYTHGTEFQVDKHKLLNLLMHERKRRQHVMSRFTYTHIDTDIFLQETETRVEKYAVESAEAQKELNAARSELMNLRRELTEKSRALLDAQRMLRESATVCTFTCVHVHMYVCAHARIVICMKRSDREE
jgi:hypothetical protein